MKDGGIAQLGEHLLCKQGVRSSILLTSTNNKAGSAERSELKSSESHLTEDERSEIEVR